MSYASDRAWSDRFVGEVKRIVGPYLLYESTIEVDREEASDLIVLHVKDKRIAVRIRKYKFLTKFPYQFTLRSRRDSGARTELEKILAGFADWLFYGFASEDENSIYAWRLINLDVFREHWNDAEVEWDDVPNGDGTYFQWFDCRGFPPDLIIAKAYDGRVLQ